MISLSSKIIKEGILSMTNSGAQGMIDEFIKSFSIQKYKVNTDYSIDIEDRKLELRKPIPKYITINKANEVYVYDVDALANLPKKIYILKISDITIKDFSDINSQQIDYLVVSNCTIHSLKGLPTCEKISLGNNKNHFSRKQAKKFTSTKPNAIGTVGVLSFDDSFYGSYELGENDMDYLKKELSVLKEKYEKLLPEMKSFNVEYKKGRSFVWFNLDFLLSAYHLNGYSRNSIYLTFEYQLNGQKVELRSTGHLELTPQDKEGKYKYYALKGLEDPYLDAGGKKFRAVNLDDFNADLIYEKTHQWIRDVIDAALKDQGGTLKRK